MSTELENIVRDLLNRLHIFPYQGYPVKTKYGTWKVDFYIDSMPPLVLSCKGLGERSERQPTSGTAKQMACIVFTEFYELRHNSDLPRDTGLTLVYGDFPLKTAEHNFHKLLQESLEVHIFSINEKEKLIRFILQHAQSLMPMAYLKMAEEAEKEAHRAEKIASISSEKKKFWLDFAESNKHYAETLKEYSKALEKTIETASSSELEKIVDMWLETMLTETNELMQSIPKSFNKRDNNH